VRIKGDFYGFFSLPPFRWQKGGAKPDLLFLGLLSPVLYTERENKREKSLGKRAGVLVIENRLLITVN
jgi:hypothetical protein